MARRTPAYGSLTRRRSYWLAVIGVVIGLTLSFVLPGTWAFAGMAVMIATLPPYVEHLMDGTPKGR